MPGYTPEQHYRGKYHGPAGFNTAMDNPANMPPVESEDWHKYKVPIASLAGFLSLALLLRSKGAKKLVERLRAKKTAPAPENVAVNTTPPRYDLPQPPQVQPARGPFQPAEARVADIGPAHDPRSVITSPAPTRSPAQIAGMSELEFEQMYRPELQNLFKSSSVIPLLGRIARG